MDAIEKRLWSAADTLRANSNYAGNEYFLPVMGLIFLRQLLPAFRPGFSCEQIMHKYGFYQL